MLVGVNRRGTNGTTVRKTRARRGGIIHELLAYAADRELQELADRKVPASWDLFDEHQSQQVIDAGLAPLLYRAARERGATIPAPWCAKLQSADLCAQVRYGNLIVTAAEVIDLCNAQGMATTLLKGISISDQHYPVAHERPMGDLDILVPEREYASAEAALVRCGFRRSDLDMGETPYHGPPLHHEGRQVWVELHTALFPESAALRQNHLFSPSNVAAHSVASTFHGRPVRRLTNELQLVYIAACWVRDLTDNRIHPSFLPPLFDAIYLLKAAGDTLDWDGMLKWLDNEMATASLYILLSYVGRLGLHDSLAGILPRLGSRQRLVGLADLRIILSLLDRYLVRGKPLVQPFDDWRATVVLRTLNTLLSPHPHTAKLARLPWNVVFPPLAPDRYSLHFHADRIARVLRGLGSGGSRK